MLTKLNWIWDYYCLDLLLRSTEKLSKEMMWIKLMVTRKKMDEQENLVDHLMLADTVAVIERKMMEKKVYREIFVAGIAVGMFDHSH